MSEPEGEQAMLDVSPAAGVGIAAERVGDNGVLPAEIEHQAPEHGPVSTPAIHAHADTYSPEDLRHLSYEEMLKRRYGPR